MNKVYKHVSKIINIFFRLQVIIIPDKTKLIS